MSPTHRFRLLSTLLLILTGMPTAYAQFGRPTTPDPALIEAIHQNDLKKVQSLLAGGADPNIRDGHGESALDAATVRDNADLVMLLLNRGADVNASTSGGVTALMMAAAGGRIVKTDARGEVDYDQDGFFDILSAAGRHLLLVDAKQHARDNMGVSALKTLLAHGAQVNAQAHDGKTALWWAVCTQNTTKVQLLLAAHANPNIQDKVTGTVLGLAVFKRLPEIVKALLAHHANLNELDPEGQTPLVKALYWHYRDMADLLLAGGADINRSAADLREQGFRTTPLIQAIRAKNAEWTRYFLDHHADVNQRDAEGSTALGSAIRNDDLPLVKALLDRHAILNGLIERSMKFSRVAPVPVNFLSRVNDPALLELLIVRGANVHALNAEGVDALYEAVQRGNMRCVKALLNHGADPNSRDSNGTTAMMIAAESGNVEIVRQLLEFGADVNAHSSSQETALSRAWRHTNNLAVLKLLTDHGADVDVLDHAGRTPLINAVMKDDSETVLFLLQHGADRAYKDSSGKDALNWAKAKGYSDIILLL